MAYYRLQRLDDADGESYWVEARSEEQARAPHCSICAGRRRDEARGVRLPTVIDSKTAGTVVRRQAVERAPFDCEAIVSSAETMMTSFDDPQHWRKRARELRAIAERADEAATRRRLLELTSEYEALAECTAAREAAESAG